MARILVVDDEELVRITVVQMLERAGYITIEAGDGDEALALLRETTVDLVITDIIMPNKESFETILEIRKAYSDLKVIAISGGGRLADAGDLSFAQKLGAHAVLSKPFRSRELIHTVTACLGSPTH